MDPGPLEPELYWLLWRDASTHSTTQGMLCRILLALEYRHPRVPLLTLFKMDRLTLVPNSTLETLQILCYGNSPSHLYNQLFAHFVDRATLQWLLCQTKRSAHLSDWPFALLALVMWPVFVFGCSWSGNLLPYTIKSEKSDCIKHPYRCVHTQDADSG